MSSMKQASRVLSTSSKALSKTAKAGKNASSIDASQVEYGAMSKAQKAFLDRVIRVDQAGELGANYIYMGQYSLLSRQSAELKALLKHMWEQEIHHHDNFNRLQVERRVRPSIFTPFWKAGAVAMGAGTALISKEAAMACTVAIETVIGDHYNHQLRILMNQFGTDVFNKETGKLIPKKELPEAIRTSPELTQLKEMISQFRDDELEHLDTAIENDAEKAVPYMLLTESIKLVCRGAIWAAERV